MAVPKLTRFRCSFCPSHMTRRGCTQSQASSHCSWGTSHHVSPLSASSPRGLGGIFSLAGAVTAYGHCTSTCQPPCHPELTLCAGRAHLWAGHWGFSSRCPHLPEPQGRAVTLPGQHKAQQALTNSFVGVRRTGDKLQHLGPLLPQPPAIQDFSVALLEVIKLLSVGRVQEPGGTNGAVTRTMCSQGLWLQSSSQQWLRKPLTLLGEQQAASTYRLFFSCWSFSRSRGSG